MDTRYFADDPIAVYLREINTLPPLTKEEEAELSQHVLADDEQAEAARKRLMEGHLSMVVSIAERYRHTAGDILELVQKGNRGLLLAFQKFADDPGTSYSAHAEACVIAAIAAASV